MEKIKLLFLLTFIWAFALKATSQVPDILNVDKVSGTYGELVTITGTGFSATKSDLIVYFGAAKGLILNSTEYIIEVLAPAGTTYASISVTNLKSKLTGYSKNYFNLAFKGKTFNETLIKESLRIKEDDKLFDLCNCDFNGDGLNDIASTNNSDDAGATSITVYQNITLASSNEISFQKINDLNLNTGKGARNITCGDLDGDGRPELVVGKGGGNADRIYVFKNVSTTTGIKFNPFITILLSEAVSSSTSRRLKIQDLDNDGKPDIIMTDQGEGKVFIFANRSTATSIEFPSSARQTIQTTAGSLVGLDVADLNNDHKPEIVCNSDKSEVFIIPNKSVAGTIKMGSLQTISIAGANLVNLKIGDLDNDRDKDIVVTNLVNNIYILVNNGNENTHSFSTPKYVETGRLPWGLDLGDLNGDGKVDIVVGTTDIGDKLTALINTTSGANLTYIPYNIGNADVSFNVNIADFNGDAKPDVGYVNRTDNNNELVFFKNAHCILSEVLPLNPSQICSGKSVNLRTTPALKVEYTWINTVTSQVVSNKFDLDVTLPGSYAATIKSQLDGCETNSVAVAVTDGGDNLPPTVQISNPGVVCENSTFKLSAELIGGVNYIWKTPDDVLLSGNEITVNNAQIKDGGRYALVLESAGCRSDPYFELVQISSIPPMEISSTEGELFCEGTTNQLSVPFIPSSQYEWKFNNNVISGVTSNTYTTSQSGTYLATVRNAYNCSGTSNSLTIKQVKQPIASFNDVASSCLNEQITFENTSIYDLTETPIFSWDFGDATTSTLKNPSHTYLKSGDFIITLRVGYANTSCSDIYSYTIKVAAFLNLEIKANGNSIPAGIFNLCDGTTAELSVNASPGQVEWNTGETTPKITISDAGIYSVISGKNSGCSSSDEIEAVLVDNVALKITSGSQRIESGSSAQLGAEGADYFAWQPTADLDDATIPNPLASPIETTEYTVVGSNSYGCSDSAMVTVYVDEKITIAIDAPKTFTPNGDGINDIWVINNIDVYESCPIQIFNRRGQHVYDANQYNNDWDGILNGKELPEGAYYYIMTCGSSEVHTGNITLLR